MWASAHCVLCVRIASADKCVSQENVYEPHVYTTKHRNIEMRLYYAYREGRERLIAVYMGCCPIRIDNIGKCIWYTHNADSEPRTFGCLSYAFSQGIPSNANKEANDTNKQTNEPKKKRGKRSTTGSIYVLYRTRTRGPATWDRWGSMFGGKCGHIGVHLLHSPLFRVWNSHTIDLPVTGFDDHKTKSEWAYYSLVYWMFSAHKVAHIFD